jgi:hypothetical protein
MENASKTLIKLAREALALEAEEAQKAGALGFMARALVQATMPHSQKKIPYFSRTNGAITLTIMAPPRIGLPYGSVPRLLMAWVTTEAVRTRVRELVLGSSLSAFMRELGMVPTGGRWGSITRLRAQAHRLFASTISLEYAQVHNVGEQGFRIADRHMLWWDPKRPEQTELINSSVTLSEPFFREIVDRPVPIDTRALKALSRSPMQLDLYCWLTYRMSYLQRRTTIPWEALQLQFGADYSLTRQFKAKFLTHLREVLSVYPAKAESSATGLVLRPSPTHVPRLS